jgi:hypothetical protein
MIMSQEALTFRRNGGLNGLGFRIASHGMDSAEFIDAELRPSQCPWTASASFYCSVRRLITMEK